MTDLCTACLCTGRNLYYITETGFYPLYSQILSEIPVYDFQVCVRICWECRAALHRFQKFKDQVKSCYNELLQYLHLGHQDTKFLEKVPNLQTHQVLNIDYPEIKEELDSLDINFDEKHSQEFVNHGQLSDQYLGQHMGEDFAQPLAQHFEEKNETEEAVLGSNFEKEFVTFANDFDVNKTTGKIKKVKDKKVKTQKRKRKKITAKKTKTKSKSKKELDNDIKNDDSSQDFDNNYLIPLEGKDEKKSGQKKVQKIKTKTKKRDKKQLDCEIKNDDSCHDFDDDYLSAFEGNGDIEKTFDNNVENFDNTEGKFDNIVEKFDNIDGKFELDAAECDNYQKNVLGEEIGNSEDIPKEKVSIVKKRQPKEKISSSEKPQCAECGKVFSSRKTLRYHLNVLHKGNNRYPCPRCGKVYQWKSNLGRHLRSHKARETGELYCELCDKRFASVATYRQHLSISKRHVPESEFSYTCDECGKKFVNKTRLRDHIDWEHLQKIKFRCQLCNKPFKCHTSLYVHLKNVHKNKGLKDNLCHVCGKSYQNAAKLRYHIVAMHTTQTPYQCGQCTAAFGWYSSLYRHVREVHYKMKMHPSKAKRSKKRTPDPLPPMMPPHMPLPHILPHSGDVL